MMVAQRNFASGGHGHHHDDHHGHDHHDDHGHGHHDQHVVKPTLDHKFLAESNANKKFIVFNGL